MVGEAGDLKGLRDPPEALSFDQGFFFWPHATGYIRVGGPDPPLGPTGIQWLRLPHSRSNGHRARHVLGASKSINLARIKGEALVINATKMRTIGRLDLL